MLGLDGAGKTSLLYRWKLGEDVLTTIPTIGSSDNQLHLLERRLMCAMAALISSSTQQVSTWKRWRPTMQMWWLEA
jgi:hypothetical protein